MILLLEDKSDDISNAGILVANGHLEVMTGHNMGTYHEGGAVLDDTAWAADCYLYLGRFYW